MDYTTSICADIICLDEPIRERGNGEEEGQEEHGIEGNKDAGYDLSVIYLNHIMI